MADKITAEVCVLVDASGEVAAVEPAGTLTVLNAPAAEEAVRREKSAV
jgi:hypothetical protein